MIPLVDVAGNITNVGEYSINSYWFGGATITSNDEFEYVSNDLLCLICFVGGGLFSH